MRLDPRALRSAILREKPPREMGGGSGLTCWRRLRERQAAGGRDKVHPVLLEQLQAADQIDWKGGRDDAYLARTFDCIFGLGSSCDPYPPWTRRRVFGARFRARSTGSGSGLDARLHTRKR